MCAPDRTCVIVLLRPTSVLLFFFSSRRRHTRLVSDWSSDVCSSDLHPAGQEAEQRADDELTERIPGRDLGPRPAELAHHEVVEERQAVERDPDDREQRQERRRGDPYLCGTRGLGRSHRLRLLSSVTA